MATQNDKALQLISLIQKIASGVSVNASESNIENIELVKAIFNNEISDKVPVINSDGTPESTGTIQQKRPLKTINSDSLEGTGDLEITLSATPQLVNDVISQLQLLTGEDRLDVSAIKGLESGNGASAYDVWLSLDGNTGSEQDYIDSLQGRDGNTPSINAEGNWVINGVDSGIRAQGIDGDTRTLAELESLGLASQQFVTEAVQTASQPSPEAISAAVAEEVSNLPATGNAQLAQVAKSIEENDFPNPNFEIPVSQTRVARTALDPTNFDFLFRAANGGGGNTILDGVSCFRHISDRVGNFHIEPHFSNIFLKSKGYDLGDMMRIGLKVRIPSATVENPVKFTLSSWANFEGPMITSDEWIEVVSVRDQEIIDFEQGNTRFIMGHDGLNIGESMYITEFTITNVTKEPWTGLRKSTFLEDARKRPILNENPHARYINESSPIFTNTREQNNQPIIKTIIKDDAGFGIEADALSITSTVEGALTRVNFLAANTPAITPWRPDILLLPQIRAGLTIKFGFAVKVEADADSFEVRLNDNTIVGDEHYRNRWIDETHFGEWRKYESLPIRLGENDIKDLINGQFQVNCTPKTGTVNVMVKALTLTAGNDEFAFRLDVNNNRGALSRWYNQPVLFVGDSTVDSGAKQIVFDRFSGANVLTSAIGGSTLVSTGRIVYTDMNGEEFADRDTRPATGEEGVDYLAIEQGMVSNDRFDSSKRIIEAAGLKENDIKMVVLIAGINDAGAITTIEGTDQTTRGIQIGNLRDLPSDEVGATFFASLKSWVAKAHSRYPNAYLVFPEFTRIFGEETSTNDFDHYYQDYRDATEAVAKLYGLKHVQINDSGINSFNWDNYNAAPGDTIHPNPLAEKPAGYKIFRAVSDPFEFDYAKRS